MKNSISASIDKHISSQITYWRQQRETLEIEKPVAVMKKAEPFITMSREYGCGGYRIAETIAGIINTQYKPAPEWLAYDRKVLDKVMSDLGLSSQLAETLTTQARTQMTNLFQTTFSKFPPQVVVYRKLAETVRTLASHGHVIIVGRAGAAITKDMERGYHVRIVAPMEWKIERIARVCNVSQKEAEKMILQKNREREEFLRTFVKFDSSDPKNYHLVINNAEHSPEDIGMLVMEGMRLKGLLK